MHIWSLSELPIEILNNIVQWLAEKEDSVDSPPVAFRGSGGSVTNFRCLHSLLLANKKLCSVVVKRLYRDFHLFLGSPDDDFGYPSHELHLWTLLSSTSRNSSQTSKAYFPYQKYVKRLAILNPGDLDIQLQALLDNILRHGQLTHLELSDNLQGIRPDADLSMIKCLMFRYSDTSDGKKVRAYWEDLMSRCGNIQSLEIRIRPPTFWKLSHCQRIP